MAELSKVMGNLMEAEMLDTDGNDSILSSELLFGELSIPQHIYLLNNYLYYRDDIDYKRSKVSDRGALNAFVRMKTPDDILQFARRYGPLGLCKHGLPPMHRESWYRDIVKDGELVEVIRTDEREPRLGGAERGWCPPCSPEPVDKWLQYSETALSLLNLAASLKIDKTRMAEGISQLLLQDRINEWLGDVDVRLKLDWSGNDPILTLTGGGVFGALGVQILTAATHNTLAVCSGCGKLYTRKARKPKPGERNFCSDCVSNKVPARLRQQHWLSDPKNRQKQREWQKGKRVNKAKGQP